MPDLPRTQNDKLALYRSLMDHVDVWLIVIRYLNRTDIAQLSLTSKRLFGLIRFHSPATWRIFKLDLCRLTSKTDLWSLDGLLTDMANQVVQLHFRFDTKAIGTTPKSPFVFRKQNGLHLSGHIDLSAYTLTSWIHLDPSVITKLNLSFVSNVLPDTIDFFCGFSVLQFLDISSLFISSSQFATIMNNNQHSLQSLIISQLKGIMNSDYLLLNSLKQLTRLEMGRMPSNENAAVLLEVRIWSQLKRLDLSMNSWIDDEVFIFILSDLKCIQHLNLGESNVPFDSLMQLPLSKIRSLSIEGNLWVSEHFLLYLSKEARFLQDLDISFCTNVKDESIAPILCMWELGYLCLDGCTKLSIHFLMALVEMAHKRQKHGFPLKLISLLDVHFSPRLMHKVVSAGKKYGFRVNHRWCHDIEFNRVHLSAFQNDEEQKMESEDRRQTIAKQTCQLL